VGYAFFASAHMAIFIALQCNWSAIFTKWSLFQIFVFSMLEHFDMGSDVLAMGVVEACQEESMHLWRKAWMRSLEGLGEIFVPMFVYMGLKGYCVLVFFHFAWFPQAQALSIVPGTVFSLAGFAFSCGLSALCAWLHSSAWVWLAHVLTPTLWFVWTMISAWIMFGLAEHVQSAESCEGLKKFGFLNGKKNKMRENMFHEQYAGFMVTEFVPAKYLQDFVPAKNLQDTSAYLNVSNPSTEAEDSEAKIVTQEELAEQQKVVLEIRAFAARLLLENCVQLVSQAMLFALTQHVLSWAGQIMQLVSMLVSLLTTLHKLCKLCCKISTIPTHEVSVISSTVLMIFVAIAVLAFCPLKVISAWHCFHSQDGEHKRASTWNLFGDGCVFDNEF